MNRAPVIAVCGAGACDADTAARAEEVGRLLAEAGIIMVCGGLGGVMEAAARGARSKSGLTIGVLPGSDVKDANPWIQAPVATGMGQARNAIIINTADAVIAVGGAYGTLSEIAFALKLGKPVVSLGSWEQIDGVRKASDPAQAVKMARESVGNG